MVLAVAGCAASHQYPVEVLERNNFVMAKAINAEVANGFETMGSRSEQWFLATPDILMERVNKIAGEKGHPKLVILGEPSGMSTRYTDNGKSWDINCTTRDPDFTKSGSGNISEVELSLYAEDKEDARKNGDYVYILIGLFNPGMEQVVSDELYIFSEAPEDIPKIRSLVCGNVYYTYDEGGSSSGSFSIKPARNLEWDKEEKKPAAAIRP